jgi:hypothetical protein
MSSQYRLHNENIKKEHLDAEESEGMISNNSSSEHANTKV